nr:Nif3-like dinuclear metal center hexameric protein [Verrucomicrobiota bacterium]
MADLRTLVDYLDRYLKTAAIVDYPGAHNGLQLENSGAVRKLGAAVDACEAVLTEAAERGISLLLVHHGLLWESHTPHFIGARYRKFKTALTNDLAIYSSHLPLDSHPRIGNAAWL